MSASVEAMFTKLDLSSQPLEAQGNAREDVKGKGIAYEENPVVSDGEIDDSTCAICLNKIAVSETAQPEGCEHNYCVCCILHWAVYKEKAWCPQCKTPFSSVLTFRTLDGQLRDYPHRESICLLKRARWFQDHVKMREQAIAAANTGRPTIASGQAGYLEGSIIDESDYVDYARYYDEFDDDEEVENYYFSAAAGHARVVIGNRRHGPNGFISSGRMQARPAVTPPQTKAKKGKSSESTSSTPQSTHRQPAKSNSGHSAPLRKNSRRSGSGSGESPADCESPRSSSGGSGKQSAGRRARRNQRRAAADARAGF